ncbi:hypothetical protein BV394_02160 [Brevirhabdus pacifica]|uniref:Uncharacterized protein n=1 Tax=Brevirhabdus pacifica TaxID=1267768 RepID=A0A1U7DFD1_9RHOB|nr:HNH endonuclease signature motif containing protein [Brevirhabdus pacifica]APX88682.1 hypothetical protein BV394_02160 [Brevirhabdus pacifica]OWU79947.1 hypothetical protein ATO5_02840 [Loktanella sp. 22II-4b]PJJ86810.1 hypothetical protein CLV77_1368 [Brevirhabdus pacifica]
MSRAVSEWIGKTDDTAIPPRVKVRVIEAQGGLCACGCGVKLGMAGERIDFDHRVALINGGENRESNIQALRHPCHVPKTREDVRIKAKTARVRKKALGLDRPKKKIPYRKFDNTPVWK